MSSQSNDFRVPEEKMRDLKEVAEGSDLEAALTTFKALADDRRLMIMRLLAEGELCVCDLVEILDIEYSKLSYHLKKLKEAQFVTANRDGNYVTYCPTDRGEDVIEIIRSID